MIEDLIKLEVKFSLADIQEFEA